MSKTTTIACATAFITLGAAAWCQEGTLRPKAGVFRDKNGVKLLTNRPEKYQRDGDYVEIKLKYERVVVPNEYRQLDSADKYSANQIQRLVERYAHRYRLDPNLIYAMIKIESNFDPHAHSSKGACGLMQLMPGTAADMGVTRIFDPAQNIAGGTQYIAKLLGLFNNNLTLALAAYNAGPNVVKRHGAVPPYKETKDYVRKILDAQRQFQRSGIGHTYLAQAYKPRIHGPRPPASPAPQTVPPEEPYTVHFNSGLTQPADEVTDQGRYYCIRFRNRLDLIRKEHVARIEPPL